MINNQLTGWNHVGAIKCPLKEKKVFTEDANFQYLIDTEQWYPAEAPQGRFKREVI